MARTSTKRSQRPCVGFVGCCLPRPCGIATFTHDLFKAVSGISETDQEHFIAALNDHPQGYDYPESVRVEIDADDPYDYKVAAEYLNEFCSVVSVQHEFGIFGPRWGANVLNLLQRLRRPVVLTCHTVPIDPGPEQREIFGEAVGRSDRVVVMNRRAIDFMQALYGARYRQIAYIGHGIHDIPFRDPPREKARMGVNGPVLLTFGLLHREKGLEYMIEAMGKIVRGFKNATYVVVGATHPRTLETEGESYRRSLVARARRMGLEENVRFIDGFCDLEDLMGYLAETDIFIAPYLDHTRMTSGALSYAAGAGKAIVATTFQHSLELLDGGRGRLVPSRSADALARNVIDLLSTPQVAAAMRRRTYKYMRGMVWPTVARDYMDLFESALEDHPRPKLTPVVRPVLDTKQRPAASGGPPKH
ncbi:MAG: glycosyltransferase family 4 protein [Candidatus Latescibacterota bacterium]|jgi:glycosyltransferase involved in cell wall biosynthesis